MLVRIAWKPLVAMAVLTAGATGSAPMHRPAFTSPDGRAGAHAPSIRFVTAEEGNVARYRVREQLVGKPLPSDAIGTTGGVTGTIVIGADGKLVPAESKFVVDVKPLKSDQSRRDKTVHTKILETDKFPTVVLAPTEVAGLAMPLPASGPLNFQLKGDLTVHGTTRPTTWKVTASVEGNEISGTASTAFTFADFSLTQPTAMIVLTVADTIKLEYEFRLVRQ